MSSGTGQERTGVNDYRSLTDTVLKYKQALANGDKKLASKLFASIQQRLCHIIN